MTLPLAHLGHWLWTFYVVPVLIVVIGILRTRSVQKRREAEGDKGRTRDRR
jgi:cytochrome c-type biogenesis protein CcmH/NrfF